MSGAALGFFFVPLNTITLSDIKDTEMASASGLFNFMRNIGTSFGTSLSINYWDRRISAHREVLVTGVNSSNPSFITYLNTIPGTAASKIASLNRIIDNQSALMGVNDIMVVSGVLILVLIPIILLAKRPERVIKGAH